MHETPEFPLKEVKKKEIVTQRTLISEILYLKKKKKERSNHLLKTQTTENQLRAVLFNRVGDKWS